MDTLQHVAQLKREIEALKEENNQLIEDYVMLQFKYENCATCNKKTECKAIIDMEEEEMLQTRCFEWGANDS